MGNQFEYIWMANKYMKRHATSLTNRQMQIKTKMGFHYIPMGIARIKMMDNTQHWSECVANWSS